MNKTFTQWCSGAILVLGLIVIPSFAARADDGDNSRGFGSIEGTWVATVPSGSASTTPFLSLQTQTPTGQAFEENNTPQVRSTAQGEWVRTGRRQFQRTLLFFNFQPPNLSQGVRVYTGVTRVLSDITLDRGGDSFVAANRFEVYNTNGVLIASGQSVAQGRRCGLGSSIPVCLGLMQ